MSLYFISTLFLIVGGVLSALPMFASLDKKIQKAILSSSFQVKFGLYGIVSFIIFAFFPGDEMMILGDFLPFVSSLILSLLFLAGYVRESRYLDEATTQKADKILTFLQIPVGIAAFAVGVLHIIFPKWILF